MTAQDVINIVRMQISDEVTTYRWTDPKLLLYINDGCRDIIDKHPEAQYRTSIVTTDLQDYTDITDVSETLVLTESYRNAIMEYVCYRVLSEDAEDNVNMALAKEHQQNYIGEIA